MARVFISDRLGMFGGRWPQGFTSIDQFAADDFLDRAQTTGRFVDRQEAEITPAWKQWIPYCVLRCSATPDPLTDRGLGVLLVQRTKGQSETRLHGSWSIGLGGHIEPMDAEERVGGTNFFATALLRELHEELDFRNSAAPKPRLVGMINDDSTEVGSVHAGLAYVLDLPLAIGQAGQSVGIREISKMRGGFAHLVELRRLWQDAASFESWSQILIHAGIAGPMGGTLPLARND